ncbi:MAG TPA: hypothetical protein DGG94_17995 [Micromonosporaceae bacterium]|nr:hypothetical protein [Micromonosporaceae bacterium]HCU51663.1 hypothetical protein [Micromonosporaceae bacterium]
MSVAVFLRGINVGGNKKIPMAGLRQALERHGYTGVKTLLQSGNVILDKADAVDIEKIIQAEFAMDVRVMIRTHGELTKVISGNPFKRHEDQPSRLAVAFLEKDPGEVTIDRAFYEPDDFVVKGKEIYLWFPNGQAETKLLNSAFQRAVGVAATVRNWNTVTKMADLTK